MGYNSDTQKITAPVDMGDISAAIGVDSLNIVVLANSEEVNQWSFRKPVDFNSPGEITDENVVSVNCGLRPVAVSKLLTQSIGSTTSSSTSYSKDECLAEVRQWQYIKPSVWCRMTDFDGYSHKAVAPDAGWGSMTLDSDTLSKMASVQMAVISNGDYAGYNFKLEPKYNGSDYFGGLYSAFSMRLGPASGESIGTVTDMDIPISYITSLEGHWRIALAVWCPNFGSKGGWGFFASRMTVGQYFNENLGSGDNLRNLFPDLATNPFVAGLMQSYAASQGGQATFDVIPLLVKNLSYNQDGGFKLNAVKDVTIAYSVPSGMKAVQFICGSPSATIWYEIKYETVSGALGAFITNTDPDASHSFTYVVTRIIAGVAQTPDPEKTVELAPLEKRQVGAVASQAGYGINVVITAQDGIKL